MKPGRIFNLSLTLILALSCILAFGEGLSGGFLQWDDHVNYVENPYIRDFSVQSLRWMFTNFLLGVYQPASWIAAAVEYRVFGLNPMGYHLVSLLFHCISTVVLYFLVIRLMICGSGRLVESWDVRLGSAAAAMFFALHPLRVEVVAWISCQPYAMAGMFSLLSLYAYVRAFNKRTGVSSWKLLGLSAVLYALACMSKSAAVTLFPVFVILDVYPMRRTGFRRGFRGDSGVWIEKLPFALIAVAASCTAVVAAARGGSFRTVVGDGFLDRVVRISLGFVYPLYKTIMPGDLSPYYAMPADLSIFQWNNAFGVIILAIISAVIVIFRRRCPVVSAAFAAYLVMLLANSGIVRYTDLLTADRYSYLSCITMAVLLAAGCIVVLMQERAWLKGVLGITFVVLVLTLGHMTERQCMVWNNDISLWSHAVEVELDSTVARTNLGVAYMESGRFEQARMHLNRAVSLDPNLPDAWLALGTVYAEQGRYDKARELYGKTLELNPNQAMAHFNLGLIKEYSGEVRQAVVHYKKALSIASENGQYGLAQKIRDRMLLNKSD